MAERAASDTPNFFLLPASRVDARMFLQPQEQNQPGIHAGG
jgi:hypothetical protein